MAWTVGPAFLGPGQSARFLFRWESGPWLPSWNRRAGSYIGPQFMIALPREIVDRAWSAHLTVDGHRLSVRTEMDIDYDFAWDYLYSCVVTNDGGDSVVFFLTGGGVT